MKAVSIPSTDDLNNYFGVNYWGKIFYWMGGVNPVNVPSGISGGSLVVLRCGGSSTIQILSTGGASGSSVRPTIYQRQTADISTGWSEWEEIVTADGTYSDLTAGTADVANSVAATSINNTYDLNDFVGSNYWGKVYFCGTSNVPANAPAGVDSGNIQILQTAYSSTVQLYIVANDSDNSSRPTIYQRSYLANGGFSSWEEIVTADGSYPTLGAGYLARRAFVGELGGDQWVKWATVSAPIVVRASILFLVNGGQDPNNEGSGLLELNLLRQVEEVSLVVCSGYIKSENFAYVINGTSIDLYVYCPLYRDYQIAVLDELIGTATNKNTYVTFSNVGTGSSTAPEGAVYAVVRNIASYAESIPVASETVFGGAKMWVKGGKLYIKTE